MKNTIAWVFNISVITVEHGRCRGKTMGVRNEGSQFNWIQKRNMERIMDVAHRRRQVQLVGL